MHVSHLVANWSSKAPTIVGLAMSALLLAGCAQTQQPGYYNPPRASSTQDAIQFAEGGVTSQTVTAPSQIQIKLRPGQDGQSQTTQTAQVDGLTPAGQAELQKEIGQDQAPHNALIPQPETFFGTLPCFHQDMRCTAQQVTLTLAPNGRWRARVSYLEKQQTSGKAETTQGCWRGLQMRPPRIVLLDASKNVRAELSMTSAEVLRLRTIDGQTPNLIYTLNRQPDLDPIAELDGVAAPSCN
ncbi:MAG: copper resistance protein NlpE [Burkholderiaceae bacterium]|nr:copper resistance protein NlpE [Burkholderiaceae bacterium]MCD8517830.1 copper resistance protein NlpE [Burkholderiaceae bacterium]